MTAEDLFLFSLSILNLFGSLQVLKLQINCQKGFLAEIPNPWQHSDDIIIIIMQHIIMQQSKQKPSSGGAELSPEKENKLFHQFSLFPLNCITLCSGQCFH